ncbi:HAD family hydrolase [Kitasatospora sp. NPDC049285]|uniref:HAD family hydrolase n=1 Tax=Kitasatospora sp. NPDC049285 TaxID=3157096 RepID=UPI00344969E1
MVIEAVLLDLDGTLLDHDGASSAALLAAVAAEFPGRSFERSEVLEHWRELQETFYERYVARELTQQEQRRARAVGLAARLGLGEWTDERADAWFAGYLRRYERSWRAYPEVPRAVRALAAGRQLGVVTNGDGPRQRRKLHAMGLGELAERTVASSEEGIAKPDPAIFRLACERLGAAPERTAYVGDRLETDALGATDAGLLGIWLDRHDLGTDRQVPRVRDLTEVAGLLT